MKALLVSALLGLVPGLVLAQSAPANSDAATPVHKKAAAKPVAKKKTIANGKHAKKTSAASSRAELKSKANQMASGVRAADAALSQAELDIAKQVYVGEIPCELGAHVNVSADAAMPGYFQLDGKGFRYRMAPVATTTGAVRLEDKVGGAVWLQIANKSMLMDQKHGQRLADDCKSPAQVAVAESMKKAPARSLLDAPAK
ncbi:hypothetical protein [Simplicispira hankyongi]|uniref:Uncharacterized protein n=1 Tax=Simplicispira hankyongi TaxID=2315688 RepID=A0A398CEM9_9BURK|nr:hypothetical protein [Simplicispira hankyongi]MBU6467408.1 hypothetical protein [Burkholderiales bacterium]RID98096.1 hypothetical protein D3F03_07400 [Simplicispira hankyongi]